MTLAGLRTEDSQKPSHKRRGKGPQYPDHRSKKAAPPYYLRDDLRDSTPRSRSLGLRDFVRRKRSCGRERDQTPFPHLRERQATALGKVVTRWYRSIPRWHSARP